MNNSFDEKVNHISMAAFQRNREHIEQEVMLNLLSEIEENPSITQRSLAQELGIALGLMNAYLKRSIKKGWIRANQVSPRRIRYFLTPEGFVEKSKMVKDYLSRSMTFFRDAKAQCEDVITHCKAKGWRRIALVGEGDLTEIALLVIHSSQIECLQCDLKSNFQEFDAALITDIVNPQSIYDILSNQIDNQRLLTLELLRISRKKPRT